MSKKINAKPAQPVETEKDTEIGTGLVYHMGKNDPQIVCGDVITGGIKVDPQATGNIGGRLAYSRSWGRIVEGIKWGASLIGSIIAGGIKNRGSKGRRLYRGDGHDRRYKK